MNKKKKEEIIIEPSEYNKYQAIAFLIILFFSIFLVGFIIWEYITPVIFGAIVSGAFYPFFTYLMEKKHFSRKQASILVLTIIILVIFIPSLYFIVRLSREILDLYSAIQSNFSKSTVSIILFGNNYFADSMKNIFEFLNMQYTPDHVEDLIIGGVKKLSVFALNSINTVIGNIFSFIFQLVIMIFVIFGLFLEGHSMKKFLLDLSPLKNEDEEIILNKFNMMNYATLFYNGVGGLIQGILAGAGFFIAGIDSVILWTSLMIVLAFIPLLGISIITIPASIYLILAGKSITGILLLVYCSVVALLTENWFKPKFMGKHVEISSFLMFFSIMGGMSAFGMAGIFYGPLIISIFFTIADLYLNKYVILFSEKKK